VQGLSAEVIANVSAHLGERYFSEVPDSEIAALMERLRRARPHAPQSTILDVVLEHYETWVKEESDFRATSEHRDQYQDAARRDIGSLNECLRKFRMRSPGKIVPGEQFVRYHHQATVRPGE
jgi:hypothetical protein